MLVVNVQTFIYQLMESYFRFHVCSSLSDDNTVLSESVEGLVNVIADSVVFVFRPNVT
jgi:hypothetical protein